MDGPPFRVQGRGGYDGGNRDREIRCGSKITEERERMKDSEQETGWRMETGASGCDTGKSVCT